MDGTTKKNENLDLLLKATPTLGARWTWFACCFHFGGLAPGGGRDVLFLTFGGALLFRGGAFDLLAPLFSSNFFFFRGAGLGETNWNKKVFGGGEETKRAP